MGGSIREASPASLNYIKGSSWETKLPRMSNVKVIILEMLRVISYVIITSHSFVEFSLEL
jgi:hypothetical protein